MAFSQPAASASLIRPLQSALPAFRVHTARRLAVYAHVIDCYVLPIHRGMLPGIVAAHWNPGAGWVVSVTRQSPALDVASICVPIHELICTFYSEQAATKAIELLLVGTQRKTKPIVVDLRELEIEGRDERVAWAAAEFCQRQREYQSRHRAGPPQLQQRERVITLDEIEEVAPDAISPDRFRDRHLGIPLLSWCEYQNYEHDSSEQARRDQLEVQRVLASGGMVSVTPSLRSSGLEYTEEQRAVSAPHTTPSVQQPAYQQISDVELRAAIASAQGAMTGLRRGRIMFDPPVPEAARGDTQVIASRTRDRAIELAAAALEGSTRTNALLQLHNDLRRPNLFDFTPAQLGRIMVNAGLRITTVTDDSVWGSAVHSILTFLSAERANLVWQWIRQWEQQEATAAPEPRDRQDGDSVTYSLQEILNRESSPAQMLGEVAAWLRQPNYSRDSPGLLHQDLLVLVGTALTRAGISPANLFDLVRISLRDGRPFAEVNAPVTVVASAVDVLQALVPADRERLLIVSLGIRPTLLTPDDIREPHIRLARVEPVMAIVVLRRVFELWLPVGTEHNAPEEARLANYGAMVLAAAGVSAQAFAVACRNGSIPGRIPAACRALLHDLGDRFGVFLLQSLTENEQLTTDIATTARPSVFEPDWGPAVTQMEELLQRVPSPSSMEVVRGIAQALFQAGVTSAALHTRLQDFSPMRPDITTRLHRCWRGESWSLTDLGNRQVLDRLRDLWMGADDVGGEPDPANDWDLPLLPQIPGGLSDTERRAAVRQALGTPQVADGPNALDRVRERAGHLPDPGMYG